MEFIKQVELKAIEEHLQSLRSGNHCDNMRRLQRFDCHYLVELEESEFLKLVFLQTDQLAKIAPQGEGRRLHEVAKRAMDFNHPDLGENWNLSDNLRKMREKLSKGEIFREALVVCEARNGEEVHGLLYLQDGSHRALAYATLLLLKEAHYERRKAYCSLSESKYQSLFSGKV